MGNHAESQSISSSQAKGVLWDHFSENKIVHSITGSLLVLESYMSSIRGDIKSSEKISILNQFKIGGGEGVWPGVKFKIANSCEILF